ncbi:MAG: ABC-2 family transporter protein [Candidatus Wallbacteria bacterium]|nr:ABC-2 family transporter protein [Candidatus Wallbacteria bacterium]
MKPYLAVVAARFRVHVQYRAAALAGAGTQLFWGLIRVMIFEAFYRSSTAVQPISMAQVASYVWLSQATFAMLPDHVEAEIRDTIRDGNVASELLRPVDIYWVWYCRCLSFTLIPTLMRCFPILLLAGLFFGLKPPPSAAAAAAAGAALLGAMLLSSAITALVSIGLLWTISGEGIARLSFAAAYLFSGMMLPLPLFPDWLRAIAVALPYHGVIDVPFRLYLGHIPPSAAPAALAAQAGWIVALVLAGRLLLKRGLTRLVVQGG